MATKFFQYRKPEVPENPDIAIWVGAHNLIYHNFDLGCKSSQRFSTNIYNIE